VPGDRLDDRCQHAPVDDLLERVALVDLRVRVVGERRDERLDDPLGEPAGQFTVDVELLLAHVAVLRQRRRPLRAARGVGRELDREPQRGRRQVRVVVRLSPGIGEQSAARAGLGVVPRVDVVLDQVVPARVVAVRTAALLVDERVPDGVRPDVDDPAEREGHELLEALLALVRAVALPLRLRDERLAGGGRPAVVRHVAPEERILRPPLGDDGVHRAPDVDEGRDLLDADGLDRVEELLERRLEPRQDAAGEVVEELVGGVDERTDRRVPDLDEVVPHLLQLDQEADERRHRRVDLGEDGEQRFPVVLLRRVEEVVDGQGEHDVVRARTEDVVAPVLREEEDVRTDGADRRELLPLAHPQAALAWAVAPDGVPALSDVGPVGEVAVREEIGDPPRGVDVREVTGHLGLQPPATHRGPVQRLTARSLATRVGYRRSAFVRRAAAFGQDEGQYCRTT
jgi:hypothetical protein